MVGVSLWLQVSLRSDDLREAGYFLALNGSLSSIGQTFASPSAAVAGGVYRLCWCARSAACSVAEEFRVDAGSLTLIGVSPLKQHRTCTSGRACMIDKIVGIGLHILDDIRILSTCGTSPLALIDRFQEVPEHLWASSAPFSTWRISAVSAAGGEYRLCWCAHGAAGCTTSYNIDIGSLRLRGFSPLTQDHSCISGLRQRLN